MKRPSRPTMCAAFHVRDLIPWIRLTARCLVHPPSPAHDHALTIVEERNPFQFLQQPHDRQRQFGMILSQLISWFRQIFQRCPAIHMMKLCGALDIPTGVDSNPRETRLFTAYPAACVHGLIHLGKSLLNRVFGQLLILEHSVAHAAQACLVLLGPSGQFLIPEVVRARDNVHAPITFLLLPDVFRDLQRCKLNYLAPFTCIDGIEEGIVRVFFIFGKENIRCGWSDREGISLFISVCLMV